MDSICVGHRSESHLDVIFEKKLDFSQLFAQKVTFFHETELKLFLMHEARIFVL